MCVLLFLSIVCVLIIGRANRLTNERWKRVLAESWWMRAFEGGACSLTHLDACVLFLSW